MSMKTIYTTQLLTTDVANKPHTLMHLNVVMVPASCSCESLGAQFTFDIPQRAQMLCQRSVTIKDVIAVLAVLVIVLLSQVHPKSELCEAVLITKTANRRTDSLLQHFFPKSCIFVHQVLKKRKQQNTALLTSEIQMLTNADDS